MQGQEAIGGQLMTFNLDQLDLGLTEGDEGLGREHWWQCWIPLVMNGR